MKICPKCQSQIEDEAVFCTSCGSRVEAPTSQADAGFQAQQAYIPPFDQYDHTAEFDPKDISDNKVISMLVYLTGWIGIVVALLASNNSPYAAFHVRQALKFTVIEILSWIVALLTCWLFFIPVIAAGIWMVVLWVVKIICFFQICKGLAKEPYIIRNFNFLR